MTEIELAKKIGSAIGTINGILNFEDSPLMTREQIIKYLKELKAELEK